MKKEITPEIRQKLEQAAEKAWEQDQQTNPSPVNPHAYVYGYKAGAQTILDNPGEWGLCRMEIAQQHEYEATLIHTEKLKLQAENERYRKALEGISTGGYSSHEFMEKAKEALKQEVNND